MFDFPLMARMLKMQFRTSSGEPYQNNGEMNHSYYIVMVQLFAIRLIYLARTNSALIRSCVK